MGNAIWGALGTTVFFLLLNIGQDRVQEQVSTDRSVYIGSRFEYFVGPCLTNFGPWIPVWELEDNFVDLILEIFLSVWKHHLALGNILLNLETTFKKTN